MLLLILIRNGITTCLMMEIISSSLLLILIRNGITTVNTVKPPVSVLLLILIRNGITTTRVYLGKKSYCNLPHSVMESQHCWLTEFFLCYCILHYSARESQINLTWLVFLYCVLPLSVMESQECCYVIIFISYCILHLSAMES